MKDGLMDFHCHLDRVNTFYDKYFEHEGGLDAHRDAPLKVKQVATGNLHRGLAFTAKSLYKRMKFVITEKVKAGETLINAVVDCSPDIEGRAFKTALRLRKEFENQITINVGAYPIFGFKDSGSERHEHLKMLSKKAQFLVALPERDDKPDHPVGFNGHLSIMIELAIEHNIPLQVHVDQTNSPRENGTERLIEAVRWLITSKLPKEKRPKIWAVHVISPSSYDEKRFWNVIKGLKENDIGVIICPHAAISMMQLRGQNVPMHNSIARVKEFIVSGIDVRIGTDNINDLFIPNPESPLLEREAGSEYGVIQSALRFYDPIWEKLMRGQKLNETDIVRVERSLKGEYTAAGMCGERPWRNL